MLNPLISFTVPQEKVNFTHDPTNVLRFSSHQTICWAILLSSQNGPACFCGLDSGVFKGCFGVLGRHRPWKRLTGFKSSLGMSFSCYFISVLFSAFSACKRQGRLPGFRAVQEIWWYRSVSVYTLWLSCTPASLSPWSIWLFGMECRHLPADIQLVSTLLLDIFRQKEDDSPCLSCLTGTLYGWKRLN